jgi:TolB-like protein/Tfp pilus assembly protein PilF
LSFFNELKRRNVFKVAIAYVIVAWLIAQVLQLVFESFGTPEWVMKTVLVLLATGLPIAIFFAWAFEMTPEGLKREYEVDRSQSITPQTGKKLNNIIFAVMAVALVYFAYDKFVISEDRQTAAIESAVEEVTSRVLPGEVVAKGVDSESDYSIAVLPFVNMSDDASNEYFSDGLSEELLNLLAKIPELRVAARTSSFSLKGKELQISEVGEILKVKHVLEGSVRKAGNQVRITAQLINVEDGYHLWSETYDRSLENIFAIQDEIASEVATQLKITLLGAAPKMRATDPQAYALYLQARQMQRQRTAAGYTQALRLLQQALAVDPFNIEAWDMLAGVYIGQTNLGLRSIDEGYTLAREATNKALAIDPDYAPAHAGLSVIALDNDIDMAASARHLERALQLEPGNAFIIRTAANFSAALGRVDEAIALAEFELERDPVNPTSHAMLANNYIVAGRWDEAIEAFKTALALSPGMGNVSYGIGVAMLMSGQPQKALEAMQQENSVWGQIGLTMAYHALGRDQDSDAALAQLIEQYQQDWAFNIAYVLAYRGEVDRAFEWLDKAVENKDAGLSEIPGHPFFTNLLDDARWRPFLESIGKSPEQLAAIDFEVTLPR